MTTTSDTWVYREAWRAVFANGQWSFSDRSTWMGGTQNWGASLTGRCSKTSQLFHIYGRFADPAYDEHKIPLGNLPSPVFITDGLSQSVSAFMPDLSVEPTTMFRSFCVEDTWPKCVHCGQGIGRCCNCGELVCMFLPDTTQRFPTKVQPGLLCPFCQRPPFSGLVMPYFPFSPPHTQQSRQKHSAEPLARNHPVYMPAHCTSFKTTIFLAGYEIYDVPDPALGLNDPATLYSPPPFFHVTATVSQQNTNPSIPVKHFNSFNFDRCWPDCPLCGMGMLHCRSCLKWLCALKHRPNPPGGSDYVYTSCPLCGGRLNG